MFDKQQILKSLIDDSAEIGVLDLPAFLEELLSENEVYNVSELARAISEDRIPKPVTTYLAAKPRRDQFWRKLYIRSATRYSGFLGWIRSLYLRNQVLYYVLVPPVIAGVLIITPHAQFDRDEWVTIIFVVYSLLVFDAGRWVRDQRIGGTPLATGRVRIIVVFTSFGLARLLTNTEFGDTEWLRISVLGFVCGVWYAIWSWFIEQITPASGDSGLHPVPPNVNIGRRSMSWRRRLALLEARSRKVWRKCPERFRRVVSAGFWTFLASAMGLLFKYLGKLVGN